MVQNNQKWLKNIFRKGTNCFFFIIFREILFEKDDNIDKVLVPMLYFVTSKHNFENTLEQKIKKMIKKMKL